MKTLGTISGTMLTPGVSRNNRLYSRENIARGVARMQERLADPKGLPIVMRTHHGAGDDASKIVGHVTSVKQLPDGSATYEAKIIDNTSGRDIAALVKPDQDGKAALRTTSIHGYWIGPTERYKRDGMAVETGDDLEIDAIDFTYSPGVLGAQIHTTAFESTNGKPDESGQFAHDGHEIIESAEATVELDEVYEDGDPFDEDYNTAQRKSMAAKGQAMSGGRYPIANKSDLRKAIRAVGRGKGSHSAIRQHIIKRAKALRLMDMVPDNWTKETASIAAYLDGARIAEATRRIQATGEHFVSISVGDMDGKIVDITASSLHPDVLRKAIKRAGALADQLVSSDVGMGAPDEDDLVTDPNDIDFRINTFCADNDDDEPDDGSDDEPDTAYSQPGGESAPGPDPLKESAIMTDAPAATAAPEITAPVAEAIDYTKLATAVAEAVSAAFAARAKAKKAAKKAAENATSKTAETKKAAAPALKESITADELEKKLAEERAKTVSELRESLLKENGLPQRQGYRVSENADGAPLTGDDLWAKRAEIWAQLPAFGGVPVA